MDAVTTICYRQKRVWKDRKDAIAFFTEGVLACEGAEQNRYIAILAQLKAGKDVCTDE